MVCVEISYGTYIKDVTQRASQEGNLVGRPSWPHLLCPLRRTARTYYPRFGACLLKDRRLWADVCDRPPFRSNLASP